MVMVTVVGFSRHDFFCDQEYDEEEFPSMYWLGKYTAGAN